MRDVEVLPDVVLPFPARPDEVIFTTILENSAVYRPFVSRIGDFSEHFVVCCGVVVIRAFENVHTVIVVVSVVRGYIDVPFSVYLVKLRRPVFR